jgi:hypothetical protein
VATLVDPDEDRRTFPRDASGLFSRCRWRGRYVGWTLGAALVMAMSSAGSALADVRERARVDIRILGRLEARPHIKRETEQTTILGVLADEAGVPVAGAISVLEPTPAAWRSCLDGTKVTTKTSEVALDTSGRFCLRGPALPQSTQARLRLSGPNHQTRDVEVGIEPQQRVRPKITASPQLIDLDDQTASVVEATLESGAPADGETAELHIDCQGTRTFLATTRAEGGRFRFETPSADLPAPGSCAFIVRSSADSSSRGVVLQGRASLSSSGWTESEGGLRAIVRVHLRWQTHTKPLTVGVLEGHSGQVHDFTIPLSDAGEGMVEVDAPPTEALSIRLAQEPLYVRRAEPLILPVPTAWQRWSVLEAVGLLGLAAFLAASWLGSESRSPRGPVPSPRVRLPGFRKRSRVTGQALDAHTGRPLAAMVELLAVGTTAKELLESTQSDQDGHFSFRIQEPGLTRLRMSANGYVTFEGPLPPGEPVVRLTERRRAALSLLTDWVRTQSPLGPVPTPGEVHREAQASGRSRVAEWAQDLAAAAYGKAPPTDRDLSALAERKPS